MPSNRHALIRYQVIDTCLRNRARTWTLEDLIDRVSDALYEYEGSREGVSRRTVQADLQAMRSEKLGYNAPIVVRQRKFYTYEDPDYSISKRPLAAADLERLGQAIDVLRQMSGFAQFDQLAHLVQKLEGHIQDRTRPGTSRVDFERNDQLHGLAHLSPLYEAVMRQHAVRMVYQSFKARAPQERIISPWWLKEFKNRWFVVAAVAGSSKTFTLALDRIQSVTDAPEHPYRPAPDGLTPELYYKDVIGVTVNEGTRPIRVVLQADALQAPYLITKPLHPTQRILPVPGLRGFTQLELRVQHNYELERELLSYGEGLEVLHPPSLRKRMALRLHRARDQYHDHRQPEEDRT